MEQNLARTMRAEIGVVAERGIIEVTFTKKDGTERVLKGTLKEEYIPTEHRPKKNSDRKPNPETMAVWDMDKNAWRSFRLESVTSTRELLTE